MPALLIRIIPLAVLLFFGLRYLLLSLRPNLFKIDYFKLDERREAVLDKIDYLKMKTGFKPKPPAPPEIPVQVVRDDGHEVYFEYQQISVTYKKAGALSNIFLMVSLHPELHANNRFAEGMAGVITLKNAARLKQKYPDILAPRGLRSHIDEEDQEKYYLIYPPHKAAQIKAGLKEAHRALFNSHERIHMQLKGQLLEYKSGLVNGKPVKTPIKAKVLYLQYAQLINAYNTAKPPVDDELEMENSLV